MFNMTIEHATTTARMDGTISLMLIWERHHGTLGPIATLTGSYILLEGYTVLAIRLSGAWSIS